MSVANTCLILAAVFLANLLAAWKVYGKTYKKVWEIYFVVSLLCVVCSFSLLVIQTFIFL